MTTRNTARHLGRKKRPTQAEKLHSVLSDGKWYDLERLPRHGIPWPKAAKYQLTHKHGYLIETRRQPMPPHRWQYRLVDDTTA